LSCKREMTPSFDIVSAAAENKHEEIAKALEGSCDVNYCDYDKRTALHLAAAEGHVATVNLLLKHGASESAKDRWGVTPLQEALHNGHSDVAKLLHDSFDTKISCQAWNCENDPAQLVLYYDLLEAGNHVSTTVYGDTSYTKERKADYTLFLRSLQAKGVNLVSIQDIIVGHSSKPDFVDFMVRQLNCVTDDESITAQEVDDFKRSVIKGMTPEQLGHAATHVITFRLVRAIDNSLLVASYQMQPMLDLLNSRLQICTPKGVVMVGKMDIRSKTHILEYTFHALGLETILTLPDPLRMSGGDYIPAGPHLAFMGVGVGTDEASVRYMLERNVFGTQRVAVVRDLFDRSLSRKHLDSVFKIIDNAVVVVLESICGISNINRRLVNEYIWDENKQSYAMSRMSVEFERYLLDQGYHIIKLPESLYDEVGLSIYNLGMGSLMVNSPELAELISSDKKFSGKVTVLDFQWKTGMYDWLYKATLIFRRTGCGGCPKPVPEGVPRPRVWDTSRDNVSHQTTNTVLMVAPVGFLSNAETAVDNHFMKKTASTNATIELQALREFSLFHSKLTSLGVRVVMFCNEAWYKTPDAVFPNNWFSTHSAAQMGEEGSMVVFYPMKTESRRKERREYIISELQEVYDREISFIQWENSDFPHFLESTGVLIMDHKRQIAYVALSQRAYIKIAATWSKRIGYRLVTFSASDIQGRPIYHTNVLMAVGTTFAVVCLESITDVKERDNLVSVLSESHTIVPITRDQMNEFCGNVLEVRGAEDRKILVMSSRAYEGFGEETRAVLLQHVDEILHTDISTIEHVGGGGVRCMLGELF